MRFMGNKAKLLDEIDLLLKDKKNFVPQYLSVAELKEQYQV